MGNGMNKVLPGLYVGNYRDSKDHQQLEKHQISHIVAIHDSPKRLLPDKHYLCVMAADTPEQNLSQYFPVCNDFIHAARLRDGNVLIHCLAGMSRSVTVAVAYIMTVTNLNWKEALKVVRAGRSVANPNLGFQTQLQEFEMFKLADERRRLRERFPSVALEQLDRDKCIAALNNYEELLQNKDICEGNCARGEKCPTGLCNADSSKGIFRRRTSTSSRRSSRLSPNQAQSCPTSPKRNDSIRRNNSKNSLQRENSEDDNNDEKADSVSAIASTSYGLSSSNTQQSSWSSSSYKMTRSASTISGIRPRSSPAGLYSYTGSTPPSVHNSRIDLTASPTDKGSAIYLGCSPPRNTTVTTTTTKMGSNWSIGSSRSSSKSGGGGNSAPPTPYNTPPVSPRQGIRRSASVVKKS